MNHTINESELIKRLSVKASLVKCDRECFDASIDRGFDNHKFGEHIYENVERFVKNKHRGLSDFVSNLKSRASDFKIKKFVKKLKPAILENPVTSETRSMSCTNSYQDEEDSYTSCFEENIYENLNFNFLRGWNDDETVLENDALRNWLQQLTTNVEDYDCSEIMITKCIPSRNKNILCTFEASATGKMPQTGPDLMVDQYKLDILNKCFTAVWKCQSEDEILSNLYIFLNDIFSSYFIRNATLHHQKNESIKMNNLRSPTVKKRRRRPEKVYGTVMCKKIDKKNVQKLETFILSVTLNRLTITYDKCMKFYFALEVPQASWLFRGEVTQIVKYCQPFIINNCRWLELRNRKELRNFIRSLRLILCNRFSIKNLIKEDVHEKFNDVVNREQVITKEENIYQPIWKWHTDCKSVIRCDNIYTPLNFIGELDEQDWEIDSEFSFVDSRNTFLTLKENMFDSICILYSNENPELNKIIYSPNSSKIINECNDKFLPLTVIKTDNVATIHSKDVIQNNESPSKLVEFDSVTAWKHLLRQPYYQEDEEDLVKLYEQICIIIQ